MQRILAFALGGVLDAILGDPRVFWHPIRIIGNSISLMERIFRRLFPKTPIGEKIAGIVLWFTIALFWFFMPLFLLRLCKRIHVAFYFIVQTVLCFFLLARRSLCTESEGVYDALLQKDLALAKKRVSYIVGRDTATLDVQAVTRATVETVAENTSDGVIAPLIYLFLGGVPLAMCYKAVNTMDSMVGYRNETYLNFGWFAAKMDDIWNLVPARLSAILMILSAAFLRYDVRGAWHIWLRDRYNHKSPNAAQTESVCAGALGIRLAGGAYYFGVWNEKPDIGDATREIEPEDIVRAGRLLTVTTILCFAFLALLYVCIFTLLQGGI